MAVKIVSCMRFSTVVSALVTAWLYLASSPEIRVRSFRELPGLCCHSLYCIIFRHRRQPATLPVEWRLWRQRRRPVFWGVVQVLVHIFVPCAASIQLSLLQVLAHMVCRSLYTQRFVFFFNFWVNVQSQMLEFLGDCLNMKLLRIIVKWVYAGNVIWIV